MPTGTAPMAAKNRPTADWATLGMPKKMDAQSDVWALGATLFHILSGQPVHAAKNMSAMVLATASNRAASGSPITPTSASAASR